MHRVCTLRLRRSQIYLHYCKAAFSSFVGRIFSLQRRLCWTIILYCSTNLLPPIQNVKRVFLCHVSTLDMLIIHCWKCQHRPTQDVWVGRPPALWLKWVPTWISRVVFLCLLACSPSGQSDGGAVRVGDGVASEHRPGQKLHLALLGERPAAGGASHRRLGVRTAVSFNAPPPPPPALFVVLICRLLGPERVHLVNLTAELPG